ncbi:hypothetical protein FHX45_000060 [Amycolatopsis granulosa]|nr:hypothetical protein [Amycolatopsis granulosa]
MGGPRTGLSRPPGGTGPPLRAGAGRPRARRWPGSPGSARGRPPAPRARPGAGAGRRAHRTYRPVRHPRRPSRGTWLACRIRVVAISPGEAIAPGAAPVGAGRPASTRAGRTLTATGAAGPDRSGGVLLDRPPAARGRAGQPADRGDVRPRAAACPADSPTRTSGGTRPATGRTAFPPATASAPAAAGPAGAAVTGAAARRDAGFRPVRARTLPSGPAAEHRRGPAVRPAGSAPHRFPTGSPRARRVPRTPSAQPGRKIHCGRQWHKVLTLGTSALPDRAGSGAYWWSTCGCSGHRTAGKAGSVGGWCPREVDARPVGAVKGRRSPTAGRLGEAGPPCCVRGRPHRGTALVRPAGV